MSFEEASSVVLYEWKYSTDRLTNQHSNFSGGDREGDIPDPIPNSEVKPFIADGTARKSVGE